MTNVSLAAMRLTGTKSEIGVTLTVLGGLGFTWKNNGQHYPQRNEANKFAFYLYDLQMPQSQPAASAVQSNEPQPRPGDMVLGGKREPRQTKS